MLDRGYPEAVKIIRKRKKLTQKECAQRVDMDPKVWSRYETGKATITNGAIESMRKALQCTESELWHLAMPAQRAHYHGHTEEVREEAPDFGTPMAAGASVVQRLMALDENALPAEERGWFKANRNALATALTSMLTLVDNFVERFLDSAGRLRLAKEAKEEVAAE